MSIISSCLESKYTHDLYITMRQSERLLDVLNVLPSVRISRAVTENLLVLHKTCHWHHQLSNE
jgi:hypothetical protein